MFGAAIASIIENKLLIVSDSVLILANDALFEKCLIRWQGMERMNYSEIPGAKHQQSKNGVVECLEVERQTLPYAL